MILVYFIDGETKEIERCQKAPDGFDRKKTEDLVRDFNENASRKYMAIVQEVEDDSLTAFLFEQQERRKKFDKEFIAEIVSSLRNTIDAVESLEVCDE